MFRCRFLYMLPLLALTTMAYGAEPATDPVKAPEAAPVKAPEAAPVKAPEAAPVKAPEAAPVTASVAAPDEFQLHEVELRLIERTNAERARFGLRPLAISRNLINSARRHTIYMCRSRTMVHSNQNLGENIAMGQPNVDTAVRTWMNSPGHRANILNPSYTQIGVAAYRLGSNPTIYWTQQFVR
jgi:uncharacterized protein YkwD